MMQQNAVNNADLISCDMVDELTIPEEDIGSIELGGIINDNL